jgi:hypothetical protein
MYLVLPFMPSIDASIDIVNITSGKTLTSYNVYHLIYMCQKFGL